MGCCRSTTRQKGVKVNHLPDIKIHNDLQLGDHYETTEWIYHGPNSDAYLVNKKNEKEDGVQKKTFVAKIVYNKSSGDEFKEVDLMKKLRHPHIVALIDYFKLDEDRTVLILEHCQNKDLRTFLSSRTPPPYAWVFRWMSQLCLGLHFVHKNGVVHYDLKLDNIFLDENFCVKLGDFGISEDGASFLEGGLRGTMGYICPEMCLTTGSKRNSWTSDAWALGCILHELLNEGREAFPICKNNVTFTEVINEAVDNLKYAMLGAIRRYLPEIKLSNDEKIKSLYKNVDRDNESYYSLVLRVLLPALLQTCPKSRPSLQNIRSVLCHRVPKKVPAENA